MNHFCKIAIVLIGLTTGIIHSLFANQLYSDYHTSSVNYDSCETNTNQHNFTTSFISSSNIHISQNSYLKFYGSNFKSTSITGFGMLVLNAEALNLQANKIDNLTINALETNLLSTLTVNNKFIISMQSIIILNNFNLFVNKQSYNQIFSVVIENANGSLLLIDSPFLCSNTDLITTISQINYNRILLLDHTKILYSIVQKLDYQIITNTVYSSLIIPPPVPPPIIG